MAGCTGVAAVSLLAICDASASLGGTPVLSGINLTVRAGEFVALCGPNGAGKSSLIRAALGLLPLTEGDIQLNGDALRGLGPRARAERLAYLPQERRLTWNMPALEIVALGTPFLSPESSRAAAVSTLASVNAGHLADRGVADMSGGERARILLARALVSDAPLLLADEPIADLDPDAQLLVLECLRARADGGRAVIASLHDLNLAARYADRIVVLDGGRLVSEGPPLTTLSPETLARTFGIDGNWIDTGDGLILSTRRKSF